MTSLAARPHHVLSPRLVALIGMISTLPLPSLAADVADGVSLEAQKAWALAHAGRAVLLGDDLAVVLHPETNSAWIEANSSVLDTGTLVVMGKEPRLAILWHSGEVQPLPKTLPAPDQVSAGRSQIADLYDKLVAKPLTTAVPPLPAGSRFEASGVLRMPAADEPEPAGADDANIGETSAPITAPETLGLWQARGHLIAITFADKSATLPLSDLVAATNAD